MQSVIELLKSHRSIRKFTTQPITPDLLENLLLAAQAAATSSFLQGATLIRVTKPESRQKIAELAGNQKYVETAAEFFVFCADLHRPGNYCR